MNSHPSRVCARSPLPIDTQYVYKGWKSRFVCPDCGRSAFFHLNFLGRRSVVCDGVRFRRLTPEQVKGRAA